MNCYITEFQMVSTWRIHCISFWNLEQTKTKLRDGDFKEYGTMVTQELCSVKG